MRKRISMPDRDFMKAAKSAAKSGQSLRATALGAEPPQTSRKVDEPG